MNSAAGKNTRIARGWKSYALGAATVAALLASTACEPGAAEDSDGAQPSDRPSATSSAKPGGGSGDVGAVAACTQEDLAVSATKESPDDEGARHLLLTVQNAGDKKCNVYHHPWVEIGDAQAPTPVIKDSSPDPGKPMTLAPGEEAHAALLVAGGARDEYEATTISLTLHGNEVGSTAGEPIDVPMPVATLYADDGQLVTYWTTASGAALDFIMSK
ncbi:DUF4232 domain-containing protein [Streptomyces sp. NBC_00234]|uniref:DUF4232 domain-containing protein n=1 Tax=Streptomyces sp. NBC_00234 TaxID=2903638 RepID=UPI002E29681F|nr:DUF4232 domain-containing protein [Streptomyces sp. NBC_00234]